MTQNVKFVGGVSKGLMRDRFEHSHQFDQPGQAADAMYVVRDDRRLEAALELLALRCRTLTCLFPAGTVYPMIASPRADIQAQRVAELTLVPSRKSADNKPRLL